MRSFCVILSLSVILGLSACQSPSTTSNRSGATDASIRTASAEMPLGGYRWELVEMNGQVVAPSANRETPHLLFLESEGRIAGSTGCNRIMGSYEILEDGILKLGPVASTKMACPDMSTEAAFLKALRDFDTGRRKNTHLELLASSGEPLARLEARPLPDEE